MVLARGVVVVVVACFFGCKHADPASPSPPSSPSGEHGGLVTEVCACREMLCVRDVRQRYAKMGDPKLSKQELETLTDCLGKIVAATEEASREDMRTRSDPVGGDPPPPPEEDSTGIPACDDVLVAYAKYFECDTFKAAGPAALKAAHDGFDAMKQGWASLKDAPQATKDAGRPAAVGRRWMG